ncbi:MAG: agmatine deiminase family protein [Paludibacteraceae bacterium]|nr:agmatine deiminase family protein [Paludibacteraceae bacterium]
MNSTDKNTDRHLPAEWEPQSGVQLTWPHKDSDWGCEDMTAVVNCFASIAAEISKRELVLIVCHDAVKTRQDLHTDTNMDNVVMVQMESNDTWARDHAAIAVFDKGQKTLLDFRFNGWGMKFAANKDNLISRRLMLEDVFPDDVVLISKQDFILEGGSIESDGNGSLLTTSSCLLSENRNEQLGQQGISEELVNDFGLNTSDDILWLNNGAIDGDDTDGHIDTLARFAPDNGILYVQETDEDAEDYYDMKLMEDELKAMKNQLGEPYQLIPLPTAKPLTDDGSLMLDAEGGPLPATYANYLVINGAVLVPTYNNPPLDSIALKQIASVFKDREIIGIDCRILTRQHGSLHCVTMQYPEGFLRRIPN